MLASAQYQDILAGERQAMSDRRQKKCRISPHFGPTGLQLLAPSPQQAADEICAPDG
jgi:hypothetical protein